MALQAGNLVSIVTSLQVKTPTKSWYDTEGENQSPGKPSPTNQNEQEPNVKGEQGWSMDRETFLRMIALPYFQLRHCYNTGSREGGGKNDL